MAWNEVVFIYFYVADCYVLFLKLCKKAGTSKAVVSHSKGFYELVFVLDSRF